ncbi:AIPR family protein [Enterovibrio norvegicus]|uniref:AIPR family protein n=1 Tax=Enterovibrio norvegicus TaxID=188144 RepID=UPI00389A10EA
MSIRQALVDDNVETVKIKLGLKNDDQAFLRYGVSILTGESIFDFEMADLVDGGHDKQIDTISINEENGTATITIIQAKYTKSFESDVIIKIRNGLDWIFTTKRDEYKKLKNPALVDRIDDIRDIQRRHGPSNLCISVYYVTNAEGIDGISDECYDEMNKIHRDYDNDTFNQFNLNLISSNELIEAQEATNVKHKNIDVDVPVIYDVNNPSIINYQQNGVQSIICTLSAIELAKVISKDTKRHIFDLNVRRYLGLKGGVNSSIYNTCTTPERNKLFWFLNNGLTITCDHFDMVQDPDSPHIKLKNIQIVNGCQTASTLTAAYEAGALLEGTTVLARIYKANIENLVDDIVVTTNTQNKITPRDLRSNHPEQIDIQNIFSSYDFFYERKPREFDSNDSAISSNTFTNDFVGRAVLSVVHGKSGDARSRKGKIWSEHYKKIFMETQNAETLVLPTVLYYKVKQVLDSYDVSEGSQTRRYLVKNASLHIARIVCMLWRKSEDWKNRPKLEADYEKLLSGKVDVDKITNSALQVIEKYFTEVDDDPDLNSELKSSQFDNVIKAFVYRNGYMK